MGIEFIGPAQQPFNSFLELAKFSLDTNCPNWRDSKNPESYIIPPLFYYKQADKNDRDFEVAKAELASLDLTKGSRSQAKPGEHNLVKDRGSDEAEHIVYKAIEKLILEKVQAPFLAIHNFDISKIRSSLKDLLQLEWKYLKASLIECFNEELIGFESSNNKKTLTDKFSRWLDKTLLEVDAGSNKFSDAISKFLDSLVRNYDFEKSYATKIKTAIQEIVNSHFREYDFVLIGPKIGIIVIEVKSSAFTQSRHFAQDNRFLPNDYSTGLHQLKSFDHVIGLLEECTGFEIATCNIRKVLFSPNLDRKRFYDWYIRLDSASQANVDKKLQNATDFWFRDDMEFSKSSHMPSIQSSLRKLTLQANKTAHGSERGFETFCPLIVGLSSVTALSSRIHIRAEKLSEAEALIKESHRVETHDPLGEVRPGNYSSAKAIKDNKPNAV